MALANKRTPRKFIKGRTDNLLNSERESAASASMANDVISQDPAYIDGNFAPVLYHMDLMQEDIDELRRHISDDRTQTDNNFTTTEKSKLAGIESGAEANPAVGDGGLTQKNFTTTLKNKLDGIEAGADVTDTTNVVNALTAGTNITIASNGTISSTASGGGGGGLTETPLAMISGRWQWSSTDSGERVLAGNTAYGLFNYYSFSVEPTNTTLRNYSSAHRIDSTTASEDSWELPFHGIWCPNNGKQVKAKVSFRIQGAPDRSTWGISLWSAPDPSSGTLNTGTDPTITLRAASRDITVTTNSYTYWTETCTTTSNMNNVWVLPLLENRSGTLTTNTYIYGQIALFLV
jgi:hypothetical protein